MKYKEWVEKHGHIDHVVRHVLPPKEELGKMTHKDVKVRFAAKIIQAAQDLGIELTDEDLDGILERLHGWPELPEFHKSHYDLHC